MRSTIARPLFFAFSVLISAALLLGCGGGQREARQRRPRPSSSCGSGSAANQRCAYGKLSPKMDKGSRAPKWVREAARYRRLAKACKTGTGPKDACARLEAMAAEHEATRAAVTALWERNKAAPTAAPGAIPAPAPATASTAGTTSSGTTAEAETRCDIEMLETTAYAWPGEETHVYLQGLRTELAEESATALTQALESSFSLPTQVRLVSRRDVEALLEAEKQKELVGCEETTCMADLGEALGADLVLAGELAAVSGVRVLTLRLIGATDAEAKGKAASRFGDASCTVAAIQKTATALAEER